MSIELLKWLPAWIGVFITGMNLTFWIVLKFNDMKHLELSVKELVNILKETNQTLNHNGERLATLEGRCKANHG